MAQYPDNKADKPIHCIACGKIIGQGFIVEGVVQLLCKCGVKTRIAAQEENKPEGRRGPRTVMEIPVDKGSYSVRY